MGRDLRNKYDDLKQIEVSIHAPAWGATRYTLLIQVKYTSFQSTRPRGARQQAEQLLRQVLQFQSTRPRGARRSAASIRFSRPKFQSTRPRGARHLRCPARKHQRSFNPRARVGRDWDRSHRNQLAGVSIHAPAWGATRDLAKDELALDVSIHAPAWGATEFELP